MYDDHRHNDKKYLLALGKRIRKIRLSKKIRQTEIAYRCNFDKSSYNAIEAGKRNTTILTLLKIANALEVPIKDFLEDSSKS